GGRRPGDQEQFRGEWLEGWRHADGAAAAGDGQHRVGQQECRLHPDQHGVDVGRRAEPDPADLSDVYRTADFGQSWKKITGNLSSLNAGTFRSIAYCTSATVGELLIGSDNGVFAGSSADSPTWKRLGRGLPPAPVFHVEYSGGDKLVFAATL